jgi:hypothetical protein
VHLRSPAIHPYDTTGRPGDKCIITAGDAVGVFGHESAGRAVAVASFHREATHEFAGRNAVPKAAAMELERAKPAPQPRSIKVQRERTYIKTTSRITSGD